MALITVRTWNESSAADILQEACRLAGLVDGEQVGVEIQDGHIAIRRLDSKPKLSPERLAAARAAMEEIIADRQGRSLGGLSIRELIDEGRRW